jgi:hypothetical protein
MSEKKFKLVVESLDSRVVGSEGYDDYSRASYDLYKNFTVLKKSEVDQAVGRVKIVRSSDGLVVNDSLFGE